LAKSVKAKLDCERSVFQSEKGGLLRGLEQTLVYKAEPRSRQMKTL